MKCKKLCSQARLLTFPKKLVVLGIVILLITPVSGYGQIYLSDHFDSQSDWDGCSDPPAPWDDYSYNQSKFCNDVEIDDAWNDAHGSTGKSVQNFVVGIYDGTGYGSGPSRRQVSALHRVLVEA